MPATATKPARKMQVDASPPAADPGRTARRAAMLLKHVSDPTRLQVLLLLADRERNVGELCTLLGGQTQPATSHHLALLRHGRLIDPRREGKNNIYSLTDEGQKLVGAVRSLVV